MNEAFVFQNRNGNSQGPGTQVGISETQPIERQGLTELAKEGSSLGPLLGVTGLWRKPEGSQSLSGVQLG